MKKIIFILILFNSFVLNAQYKFYTSIATGLSFHTINNKEDKKTTDFVLHQKSYRNNRNKFSFPFHFRLGYLINKHFGFEISSASIYINTTWWSYGLESRNCNREIVLNNYVFPLNIHFRSSISKRINYKVFCGFFINYVPTYYLNTHCANLNSNVPDRFFDETFSALKGYSIQESDTGQEILINYKLNKPLITKFQFGYTGAIQLGYNINSRLNLFIQIQGFKTITDLENKKEITFSRSFNNGTEDAVTLNYYSNMYKQFYARNPTDINNRPKSTLLILNSILGLQYNFYKRKNDEFIIHY